MDDGSLKASYSDMFIQDFVSVFLLSPAAVLDLDLIPPVLKCCSLL